MFSDSFEVEKLKLNELKVSLKTETKSFFFRLSTFTTARNGFSLFSGCQWVCISFFCLFVKFVRQPLSASKRTNSEKPKVNSSSFFSCLTDENRFQPANQQIQQKAKLVFLYSNRKSPFPEFRSLNVVVSKAKSPILSFKICEELSAEQMPEEEQIRDNKTRLFMS